MTCAVLLAGVLMLGACGGGGSEQGGDETGNIFYSVRYTVSGDEYDAAKAEAALERCTDLPGASMGYTETSDPPGFTVRFSGTADEQDRLEACLRALPDTEISGPRPVPADGG